MIQLMTRYPIEHTDQKDCLWQPYQDSHGGLHESPEVIPGRRLGCPSFQVVVVSSGNACATPLAGPASYPTSVYNL